VHDPLLGERRRIHARVGRAPDRAARVPLAGAGLCRRPRPPGSRADERASTTASPLLATTVAIGVAVEDDDRRRARQGVCTRSAMAWRPPLPGASRPARTAPAASGDASRIAPPAPTSSPRRPTATSCAAPGGNPEVHACGGEDVGVLACQDRRHRAARRQARHVDAIRVDGMGLQDVADHSGEQRRLAGAASLVAGANQFQHLCALERAACAG
jgi:hypothetical protein